MSAAQAASTRRRLRDIARLVIVAITYYVFARLGLLLAFRAPQVTPVWPPTGIALAAYLIFGARMWPGIFAGAFIANATITESLATAAAIAVGNTCAWLVAASLLRIVGFDRALARIRDVLALVCCGCIAGALISATNGALQLALAGLIPWSKYWAVWRVWWIGDSLGALIVAPVAITFAKSVALTWTRQTELGLLMIGAVVLSFVGLSHSEGPLQYVVFPIILWAALRFRQREVALTVLVISAIAVGCVVSGYGPFVLIDALGMQLLYLDAYLGFTAITAFTLGAVVAEMLRARDDLRRAHDRLGVLVEERTAELNSAYGELAKAQEIAHVGSWQWTVSSRRLHGSDEFYRILDIDPTTFRGSYSELMGHVHPDDREHVANTIKQLVVDERPVRFEFRVNAPGGTTRIVRGRGETKTDADGRRIGVVGTVEDVTVQREWQRAIERSLDDKELLLKEIHHRVKNNLQVISSLLNLQARFVADARVGELFLETNARVRSIALVHENLYEAENLASIDAAYYFKALADGMLASYGAGASVVCVAHDIKLTISVAIPCGLIVTELLSNALKYAFPDARRGTVVISLTDAAPNELLLEVRDDGVGIPAEIDIETTKTMGLQLVQRLAAQLHARVEVERRGGTTFRFRFPKPS